MKMQTELFNGVRAERKILDFQDRNSLSTCNINIIQLSNLPFQNLATDSISPVWAYTTIADAALPSSAET